MAFSITDLVKSLSKEEIKATLLGILETLELPVASWGKGAVIRTLVTLFSTAVSPLTAIQAAIASSGFLDWAEGDMLSLLAEQVYGVTRPTGTFAPGFLTLNNAQGGNYPQDPRTFTIYNPATKKRYWNTAAFTLGPLETGLVIPIVAIDVGSSSTSAAGTITALETTLLGVTCTNAAAVIGTDAMSDPELRELCRLQIAMASPNGPADAYDFVCRNSLLNGGVVVNRTRPKPDSDTGAWTTYVAGPSGAIGAPDIALLQNAVDRLCTPMGFDMTVVSATPVTLAVSGFVYVYTKQNVDSDALEAAAEAALTAYVPTLPIGGDHVLGVGAVYVNALEAVAKGAIPTGHASAPAFLSTLTVPSSNFAVDEDEVVMPGVMSITAIQVNQVVA